MITFFRKIRYNLMDHSKTRQYVKYAIGEIILVVIGILIALQINNWNTERLSQLELQSFLMDIGKNIEQDLVMAKSHRQKRNDLRIWNRQVIKNQLNDIYNIEDYKKAERFFYEFYFTPNKSGFEALKNSGNIGKLQNKKIDSLLKAYYSQIDIIREKEISYNTFIESIEFKFKTEYSSFDYIVRIRSNYFDSISNLNLNSTNEQNKLLDFFKSKSFQAAVVRTGAEGTGPYTKLIDIGEGYLAELNTTLK